MRKTMADRTRSRRLPSAHTGRSLPDAEPKQARTARAQARPVNMADVARLAGVSHMTVSRVLNNHTAVREETRRRVLAAIKELGYQPNTAARALATRRSGVIGVLTIDTTLYGPAGTLYAVENAARRAGFSLTITSIKTVDPRSAAEGLDRLTSQAVEGIVVIAPSSQIGQALSPLHHRVPMVTAGDALAGDVPAVYVDQAGGARLATNHLLEHGAERIWHVAGPRSWLHAQARARGWRSALKAAGLQPPGVLYGDWTPASGYRAGLLLVEKIQEVDAVFVANDQMALGVLRAFHEHGIRVPRDVLLVGFDDIPEAAYFAPPLTTIRQDFAAVGEHAIRLLISEISGEAAQNSYVVPAQLIVRQSSIRRSH